MNEQHATRLGLDVGFGDVKLVHIQDGRPLTVTFPSILGRAEDRARANLGLGGRRQRIQRLEYGGQTYFVGDGAIVESRLTAARQDSERIGSVEERVLMLAALVRAGIADALIVTGLPVLWWDRRRDLVRSWQGEHQVIADGRPQTITVREVRPVWQPLGSFYAYFLADSGAARVGEDVLRSGFGVVDIGFNTTDLSGVYNLEPVAKWSGGVRVGVRDALDIISAELEARYGVRRPLAELAVALRTRQPIQIYRDRVELDGLATSALTSLAEDIRGQATRQWSQADRFHTVLITGGGAALVGKALKEAFPCNAEILPDPALANACGFARFAQRKVFKADRAG